MLSPDDILWLDLETASTRDIRHGAHVYAEHSRVLLVGTALGSAPVLVEDFDPRKLQQQIDAAQAVGIHNSAFDVTILRQHGVIVPLEKLIDTMALALLHGLPGSLDALSGIFNLQTPKDKAGKKLIRLFCIPRKDGTFNTSATHPAEWEAFKRYAGLDVEAMRELYPKLPKWSWTDTERRLWVLDQTINQRGIAVDVELAEAAVSAVDLEQKRLADRTQDLTLGLVNTATQRDAMIKHVSGFFGLELDDLRGSTVEKLLEDASLDPALRELLEVRLSASTTSTAKYQALLRGVSSDGRLRGTVQYCGASRTARWAGRLMQLQNLPRPTLDQAEIESGIAALKAGCADLVAEDVMELASSAIRGCIVAAPGKKLVVCDLSAIEGRVLAWLAGEHWKTAAYAAGSDLYKLAYAKSFNTPVESVTKEQRQIGKILELAMGYGGGPGAFATFALGYGTDLEAMADKAWPLLSDGIRTKAKDAWDWTVEQKRPTQGMSEKVWIVCDSFKRSWRLANAAISSFWYELEDAARLAVDRPGDVIECRKVRLVRNAAWLRIILPSGRSLSYPAVRVEDRVISFMGTNQFTRKWERLTTFGGRLVENVTQACSRDILAEGLMLAEQRGYPPVMHVHDEILAETPDTPEFTAGVLASIMSRNPSWAEGLPLAAAGFETYRYRKD